MHLHPKHHPQSLVSSSCLEPSKPYSLSWLSSWSSLLASLSSCSSSSLSSHLFITLCAISLVTTSVSSTSIVSHRLDGTPNSFLQYPSWHYFFSKSNFQQFASNSHSNLNSISEVSLSFEFKCDQFLQQNSSPLRPSAGGLLLYSDDETGIGGIFVEIKLLSESDLRVRIDDNSGVRTKNIIELRQQINFTDGQWHRLELIRRFARPNQYDVDDPDLLNIDPDERAEAITLKVDTEVIRKKIELSPDRIAPSKGGLNDLTNRCIHRMSAVFIGGIPPDYQHQYLSHLALPTVAYELHFSGSIRNVYYASVTNEKQVNLRLQTPIAQNGLLPTEDDQIGGGGNTDNRQSNQCLIQPHQVCQHGGYCYPVRNGTYCDCSVIDYEGPYCQKEKLVPEATFRGTLGEYLGFNSADLPNGWSLVSTSESFELSFRTKSANGLLLLISDELDDYLAVTMRDAGLSLSIKLESTIHEKTIKPSKVRFDDNQWHQVLVTRKIREISPSTFFCQFSITVDGIYTQYGSTAGVIPYFISKVFYVGGIVTAAVVADPAVQNSGVAATGSNFVGCLRKIIFVADNIRLDLLDLINRHNNHHYYNHQNNPKSSSRTSHHSAVSLFKFYGNNNKNQNHHHHRQSSMTCEEVDTSDPITFTTAESYLRVGGWNSPNEGSISLKIRTNEPNGVVLYSSGHPQDSNSTNRDYIALELLDGHLYLLLNLGSSSIKVKATGKRIDDTHWHTITVNRTDRSGQIVVDESVSDFVSPGTSNHLDLGDSIYLGGFPRFTGHKLSYTPPELWSASLGYGYIGCVQDFSVNNHPIDIAGQAKRQDSGSVKPSCHSSTSQCSNLPCQNGGSCSEGWNRYSCDCSRTSYTGSVCAKNSATLSFNGEQYLTIILPEELRTQSESLYIRFRTSRPNGLLLATAHSSLANHYLALSLESGSVQVDLNYGEGHMERVVVIGTGLNDDHWHTIHIERRGPSFEIELDSSQKQVVELTGQHYILSISSIHVGARFNPHKTKHNKHYSGFVGYMQNFEFNGQPYFEKARDGQLSSGSIRMTAKLGKKDRVLHSVATFKSKYTFVGLPQLKAYSKLNIYFQFKTREPNGLILFNGGGERHDFVAIELVNGQLHYIFDQGDGPRRLQSKSRTILNDNRWHTVTIGRPSLHQHTLLIDDSLMTTSTNSATERNLHLDLDGLLYFGGVRDNLWETLSKSIKSKHGYEGCIASLDLNGETFNLAGKEVLIPSTLVESGCSAPITRCSSTACANRGICVQLWNSYTCDCDLTTFSGPTCADGNESTAYQFGPNPGLITFTFEENNRPDTRNDLLAMGFLTSHQNGALVRVDSGTSADYLQLELLDGNVLVVYNLGTEDIDIGELGIKVNDGKYHIIRFTRSGQNSTLQIDNHNVLTKSPGGKQLNIFNSHAKIQIGGHKNVLRNSIEKSFAGIIAGLVFNGHRLLDMAAEDDPRIKIEGEVELMISIGNQQQSGLTTPSADKLDNQMLAEPKSSANYGNDDLIYSGAGSGCFDVTDDEECTHVANEGSGDDLITPVYVAVNRFRPTTPSTYPNQYNRGGGGGGGGGRGTGGWRKNCQNEDDDDCVEGSGDDRSSYPNGSIYSDYYSTTHRPWTTRSPATVSPIQRPPTYSGGPIPPFYNPPPTLYPYGGNHHENPYLLRPKTTAPSWTKPVYSVSGPTRPVNSPVEPQGPPEIYEVPLNIPKISNDTPPSPIPPVLSRSTNDRTVMIIGMIAICLIIVVIIAPIVLFFKVRYQGNDAAYKVENFGPKLSTMPIQGSAYPGYAPVIRATSVSGMMAHPGGGGGMMPQQPPGAMGTLGRCSRPGTRPGTPTDMGAAMKKKDPHEWYV